MGVCERIRLGIVASVADAAPGSDVRRDDLLQGGAVAEAVAFYRSNIGGNVNAGQGLAPTEG